MNFVTETRLDLDPFDVVMQADDDELQELVDRALTKIMMEEVVPSDKLLAKLRHACLSYSICT